MRRKLTLLYAYIVCLFAAPKAITDAINSAVSPDDLDEKVCLIAGVDYGKIKKKSNSTSSEDAA